MLLAVPAVSVCVAGSRSGRALVEAVRSVLDQTFRDLEVVVVGDASIDVVRSLGDPRVRVERAPVSAGYDGRSLAVQIARAPLVKVLRPHDLLHPRCLDLQVAAIESDPTVAMVASRWHVIDGQGRVRLPHRGLGGLVGARSEVEVGRRVLADGGATIGPTSTVLFRHDVFLAAGRWGNEHPAVIDLELWLRLLEHGGFLGLPEPLAAVRLPPTRSRSDNREAREELRAFLEEVTEAGTYPRRGLDRLGAPVAAARRTSRALLCSLAGVPSVVA